MWTLAEFLEERTEHESGSIFCTTDAHKAFDQVFREGTTYLLYKVHESHVILMAARERSIK